MSKRRLELLGFLFGVATTVACGLSGKELTKARNVAPADQTVQCLTIEIPDAPWEPAFFEALEKRTKKLGLSSLRRTVLPDNDLEVRFWYDHFEVISGVIIRRSGEEWSAMHLRQQYEHEPSMVLQESLGAPKSGWEAAWKRLTNTEILTLPDGSVNCKAEVLDGVGYVVETNVNRKYRTYSYFNPQLANCDEAKRILLIESILSEEFSLHSSQK